MKADPEITSGAKAAAPAQPERELRINLWRDNVVMFEGTAAQLQAEGVIPDELEWPRAAADANWEAGGFDYSLCRCRPAGHKGPMSSWLALDNWRIRIGVIGRDYRWGIRRSLERKAEELRADYYRHTTAGAREWEANWRRYWQTVEDKRFQKFKALIPGLIPPKRGRKPRQSAA